MGSDGTVPQQETSLSCSRAPGGKKGELAMPPKICIVGGERFQGPGSRCPAHAYRRWAGVKESSRTGYRYDWPRRRAEQLKANPNCAICGAPATTVDHVVSKAFAREVLGWTVEQIEARSNLQSLDRRCHAKKTAAEGQAARRRKRRHGGGEGPTG